MSAPFCAECGGTRWVPYFSETVDGNIEKAFRLCPCNHKSEMQSEHAREESECAEIAVKEAARPPDPDIRKTSLWKRGG